MLQHEVSTLQMHCPLPVSSSVTHRALRTAGLGLRQFHCTNRRGVDCADVPLLARLPFRYSTDRWVGSQKVSQDEVSTVQVCCLQPVVPWVTHPLRVDWSIRQVA